MPIDANDVTEVPARPMIQFNQYYLMDLNTSVMGDPNGPIRTVAILQKVGHLDSSDLNSPYVVSPVDPQITYVIPDLRRKMLTRPALISLVQQINEQLRQIAEEDGIINTTPTPSGANPSGI